LLLRQAADLIFWVEVCSVRANFCPQYWQQPEPDLRLMYTRGCCPLSEHETISSAILMVTPMFESPVVALKIEANFVVGD
jgi:hypothetical protein